MLVGHEAAPAPLYLEDRNTVIPAHSLAETNDQVFFPNFSTDQPYEVTFHDGTVRLSLDAAAFDFHIDASPRAIPAVVEGYIALARRLGFMVMDDCEPELQDDGFVRVYLCPIEPIADVRYEMPSLAETAFGPYSMEIPAIGPEILASTAGTNTIPRIPALPPLPYLTEPARVSLKDNVVDQDESEPERFETDWLGRERRVGRHRRNDS